MKPAVEVQSIKFDLGNGAAIELEYGDKPSSNRHCGSCSTCCRLLPIKELNKPGGVRCHHQRLHQGGCCKVYGQEMAYPRSCAQWSCRWLVDPALALPRPDRSHYVIDVLPDFLQVEEQGGNRRQVPAVQIWVDPLHPDAHREPRLRAWINTNAAATGMIAVIRDNTNPGPGLVLIPPVMTDQGQWIEREAELGAGVGLWSGA